jgi:phosphoesterase RecJ-like protein
MHRYHDAFVNLVDKYTHISVLTHLNPDPDTLGTALGVAHILRHYGKSVEVVSASKALPYHIDFLDGYGRIKREMSYRDSLIIACDCGDSQQIEFDINHRDVINIDHHFSNSHFGTLNIVNPHAISASQSAFELFEGSSVFSMDKISATAFYTALLSDSKNFTTNNVTVRSFEIAGKLLGYGVDHQEVSQNLNRRNSLASIRILARALESFELHLDAQLSSMVVSYEDVQSTGATLIDMQDILLFSDVVATTLIGVVIVELEESYKVSLRSRYPKHDVSALAALFGGGGHKSAAGFRMAKEKMPTQALLQSILAQVKRLLKGEEE